MFLNTYASRQTFNHSRVHAPFVKFSLLQKI